MRQTEDPSQQASGRRVHIVVRLHTSQDQIVGHRPDRGREDPCVLADIERGGIVVCDSDGLVRTLRECLSQHLLGPLRAEREGDHATSVFLLDPDGFFQSEFVRRVQFVVQRVPSDVLPVRRNLELQVRVRDLFEAYHDVEGHGGREEETDAISSFPNAAENLNVQVGVSTCSRLWVPMHDVESARDRIRPFVERARRFSGWQLDEFTPRPLEPSPPWSYEAQAEELLQGARSVLDMGTGGGELFETLSSTISGRAVATESWSVNAPLAAVRLRPHGIVVVQSGSLRLPFRDAVFDVVLNRHEELEASEVARVLALEGTILTQQVGRNQWHELRTFFPRMQDFGDLFDPTETGSKQPALPWSKRGPTNGRPLTAGSATSCSSSASLRGRSPTSTRSAAICPRCWPPKKHSRPTRESSSPRAGSSSRRRRPPKDDLWDDALRRMPSSRG